MCTTNNSKIKELIDSYNLPEFPGNTEEMTEILQRECYGYLPKDEYELSWNEAETIEDGYADFDVKKTILTVSINNLTHSWPVFTALHRDNTKRPFFILNNFRDDFPDRYCPVEEILDNGFNLIWFCYQDVTGDDGDFNNGLAKLFAHSGNNIETDADGSITRKAGAPGKIAMWAWANMRVMDFASTLDALDLSEAALVGHSRLGKTALFTGLFDRRFKYIFSNNAGCCGDACERMKVGEHIADITNMFPFWFQPELREKYMEQPEKMPYDQHFLIAAQYPKHVYVAASEKDEWADPKAEYLTVAAASEFYKSRGIENSFVHPDRLPEVGETFASGHMGFHLRSGAHFLSRRDWIKFMEFVKSH